MKELLNERQVAIILGLSRRTLSQWRWRKKGLRFMKIGRSVRYSEEDIEEFLRTHKSLCVKRDQ